MNTASEYNVVKTMLKSDLSKEGWGELRQAMGPWPDEEWEQYHNFSMEDLKPMININKQTNATACSYAGCGCINYNEDLMRASAQMIVGGNCITCGHAVNLHPRKPTPGNVFFLPSAPREKKGFWTKIFKGAVNLASKLVQPKRLPPSPESTFDVAERHAVNALQRLGEVSVHRLTRQEAPQETATLAVHCCPGVFPMGSAAAEEKKTVFVDKNFRGIFQHLHRESRWGGGVAVSAEPAVAILQGPPGSGKSMATYATMRHLSSFYGKETLYVAMESHKNGIVRGTCALFVKDAIVMVRPTLHSLDDLMPMITDVLQGIQTKVHCVVLDGLYYGGGKLSAMMYYFLERGAVEYLVMTSSVTRPLNLLTHLMPDPYVSEPWSLADYMRAVDAGMQLSAKQLKNIGCTSPADVSSAHDPPPVDANLIKAAFREKFLVAGYCCRFMLDYNTKTVIHLLRAACDGARKPVGVLSESSERIRNTLVVSVARDLLPVSPLAAAMMGHYGLNPDATTATDFHSAAREEQQALLGWFFEKEALDRLTAGRISTVPAKDAPVKAEGSPVKGAEDVPVKGARSVEQHFAPMWRRSQPAFSMHCYDQGFDHPFPAEYEVFHFYHWQDVVVEVGRRVAEGWKGHLVLVPKHFNSPFFDFALVTFPEGEEWNVGMDTFQLTVAEVHSCNATIVQRICNGLAQSYPEVRFRQPVEHFAVVPTRAIAARFRFTDPVAMGPREHHSRAAKWEKANPGANAPLEVERRGTKRRLIEIEREEYDEVVTTRWGAGSIAFARQYNGEESPEGTGTGKVGGMAVGDSEGETMEQKTTEEEEDILVYDTLPEGFKVVRVQMGRWILILNDSLTGFATSDVA